MKTLLNTLIASITIILALHSNSIQAATLWNVDLNSSDGTASGAAVLGSAGDTWNVYNASDVDTAQSAIDNAGGNSIGFSFSAPGGNVFGFNPSSTSVPTGLFDGFGSSQNGGGGSVFSQLSFTFSGLAPNADYNVIGYGASQAGTDRGTLFFGAVNSPVLGYTDGSITDIAGGDNKSWDDFTMTTDGSGSFTINTNFNSNTSAQGPVNGFQVEGPAPVPEPSSSILLGLGVVVASFRTRKSC